jgi:chorismate synthase
MDVFEKRADGTIGTATNHSGGIQGGISNGEDITMRIAFKPVPTLMRDVPTVDRHGNPVTLHPRGRHDVCVLPRALPVVEAMAALVILDNYLIRKTNDL